MEAGKVDGLFVLGADPVYNSSLGKRFGELSEDIQASVSKLSLTVLEELGEALLDFSGISEVQNWLAEHSG